MQYTRAWMPLLTLFVPFSFRAHENQTVFQKIRRDWINFNTKAKYTKQNEHFGTQTEHLSSKQRSIANMVNKKKTIKANSASNCDRLSFVRHTAFTRINILRSLLSSAFFAHFLLTTFVRPYTYCALTVSPIISLDVLLQCKHSTVVSIHFIWRCSLVCGSDEN